MAHRLEVLSRPTGATRAAPRVVASAGLSLSFKIPPSYARRAPAASVELRTRSEKREEEAGAEELAWDERDWEKHEGGESAAGVKSVDEVELARKPVDDWEESAAPDLPDDFPRLILNLSKLQRQHFPDEDLASTDVGEFVATVKTALHRHFTHMVEALFDQREWGILAFGWSSVFGLTVISCRWQNPASIARTGHLELCLTGCTLRTRMMCFH